MKVYGANISPYVRKVLVALEAKGLAYDHEPVMPGNDDPDFRAISPLGKIPGLTDGELKVSDSSVICDYLEDKYPQTPLLPPTPELRARSRWYEEFADSRLIDALIPFFFERIAKRLFGDSSGPDEARLAQVEKTLVPQHVGYLESQAPETGFMFGDSLGIADIALVSPQINAEYAGYTIGADDFPRTAAYRDRVRAHPAFATVLAVEKTMLKALTA